MAIPRSSAQDSFAPSASLRASANTVFTSIAAGATTNFTIVVPRGFRPNRVVTAILPNGLQGGLVIGNVTITGNTPSTGAATKGYTLNVPITNTTAGALVPTAGPIYAIQD